jgi:hypothetical protein
VHIALRWAFGYLYCEQRFWCSWSREIDGPDGLEGIHGARVADIGAWADCSGREVAPVGMSGCRVATCVKLYSSAVQSGRI